MDPGGLVEHNHTLLGFPIFYMIAGTSKSFRKVVLLVDLGILRTQPVVVN